MVKLWLAAVALAIASFGACTLLEDAPPKNSCTCQPDCVRDTACFRAQGEVCDSKQHVCVPQQDAGIDAP